MILGWIISLQGPAIPRQTRFLPGLLCLLCLPLPSSPWSQSQLDPTVQLFGSQILIEGRVYLFASQTVKPIWNLWYMSQLCAAQTACFTVSFFVDNGGIALQPHFFSCGISLKISAASDLFLCSACDSLHLLFASQKINYCGGTISIYYIFFSRKKSLNHPLSSRIGMVTCLGPQLQSRLLPGVSQSVKCLLVTYFISQKNKKRSFWDTWKIGRSKFSLHPQPSHYSEPTLKS